MEKETIKRYDEIAEEYDKDWRGKHDKTQIKHLKRFERIIGLSSKKILDAGCGTGKDCIFFASRGHEVYGIDLSQKMLEKALEKSNFQQLKVNLFLGDMKSLNFPNNFFDGIWSTASLVHLHPIEKPKAIREFYRVLKPRGVLHIWVQNLLSLKHLSRLFQSYLSYLKYSRKNYSNSIPSLKERIKLGYAYIDRRHWFYPTKNNLLKILRNEGFLILETGHLFSRRLSIYAQKPG